jgi:long-subunit fatty acid transport protein
MTKTSQFTLHDDDIVVLESKGSDTAAKGWVNIGPQAIQIEMDSSGHLKIEVHARTNETTPLASLNISNEISVNAGVKIQHLSIKITKTKPVTCLALGGGTFLWEIARI